MTMKVLAIVGWICFALDALFIIYLFAAKNAGDDAAGRGVATGYALVLVPILLAFGGVLWWSTRNSSRVGTVAGVILLALPFIFLAKQAIDRRVENAKYLADKARDGRFKSPVLSEIAAAIDAGDSARTRGLLLANKSLDYNERDEAEHTLLGFAVTRATDYLVTPDEITPGKVDALRILLESGVPYRADALRPNGDWVRDLVVQGGDAQNVIVEMALKAGANVNAADAYGEKPMIFSYAIPPSRLAILVKHGADLQLLDDKKWTLLMNAVYFKKWASAKFFLEHNVSADYVAPDSNSVRTLLDAVVKSASNYHETPGEGYEDFVAALNAKEAAMHRNPNQTHARL